MQTVDLKQIGQSDKASFSVQLNPGSYVIDINRIGIDNSKDLPTTVHIQPGQTVVLDIDIDTGIR